MVHINKCIKNGITYLSLQKTIYVDGKIKTMHIKYLGRADKYTQKELRMIIGEYNTR